MKKKNKTVHKILPVVLVDIALVIFSPLLLITSFYFWIKEKRGRE